MAKQRRKLSEITNTPNSKILGEHGEPEKCIVHDSEATLELDVVNTALLQDGVFGDYQIEYLE